MMVLRKSKQNNSDPKIIMIVKNIILKVGVYILLLLALITTTYPIIWMVFGSLKSDSEFYSNIWGPPASPVWRNYSIAWEAAHLGPAFVNSIIVTLTTIFIVVTFTSLSAYAFAKFKFPGRKTLFYFFLLSLMIPNGVLVIPIFSVISELGIVNTRLSMILVYSGGAISFGTFLLHAYFLSIPSELEDAALIDGCTPIEAYFRIILPIARPALATQVIFTGLSVWNEYLLGSVLVRSREIRTLPLGLVSFIQEYSINYPQYFATIAMVVLPIIGLYIIAQRQFITGLTAGAIRG